MKSNLAVSRANTPITALVVTHNSAASIGRTIESLPWTDFPGFRAVVVDNASTDGTTEFIAAFTPPAGGRLVSVLNTQNRLFANAINQGLARIGDGHLLLAGHDCFLQPGAVKAMMAWLERHPDVGVVAPRLLNPDGSVQPSCRRLPTWRDLFLETSGLPRLFPKRFKPPWKKVDLAADAPIDLEQPEATCLLVRREALDQVGPMDLRFPLFFNDVDWCRRFAQAGWRIIYLPEAQAIHLKGAAIYARRARTIWRSHQGFYRYFHKYKQPGLLPRLLLALAGLMLLCTALIRWLSVLLAPRWARKL